MRIIPQEELDEAEVETIISWLLSVDAEACCIHFNLTDLGCTVDCRVAGGDDPNPWHWHGTSGSSPTPETIFAGEATRRIVKCPQCSRLWLSYPELKAYVGRVHARAATMQQALGDFDEEAERARLMPV